ncbi:MAG: hypothetical protein WC528_01015 [Patescibacteria group bacterium]
MQFIVPQFIDVENKIIGPISVRQFITLLVGGLFIYVDYEIFFPISFWLFAIIGVVLLGVSGTFAFLRISGRPFHYFILNLFNTFKEPRLRVWNKQTSQNDLKYKEEKIIPPVVIPQKKPLSATRLAELSLLVDTGGVYHDEEALEELEDRPEKMAVNTLIKQKNHAR